MDKTTNLVTIFSCQTDIFIINLLISTVYSKYTSFMWHADKLNTYLRLKDLPNRPA